MGTVISKQSHPPTVQPGSPLPLGVHRQDAQLNFSIAVHGARRITLRVYPGVIGTLYWDFLLDGTKNRSGSIWHLAMPDLPEGLRYAYLIEKDPESLTAAGVIPHTPLLDPYAISVVTPVTWHSETEIAPSPSEFYHPLGLIPPAAPFDWRGDRPLRIPRDQLIIYEMHVRGFTRHASSHTKYPGTFLGIIERIDHLKQLGVNAIELMPIWEFNEAEYNCCSLSVGKHLCNYWGYSPVSFFALMNRYASSHEPGAVIHEFKTFVKAMHGAGIEVILDVVFNHTAEGGFLGPTYSWKGIDPAIYYLCDAHGRFLDFTGCSNTINSNHPQVIALIVDSLRYWVSEMHVDGFRFDLTSIFCRGPHGQVMDPAPVVHAITEDPLLADCKLIAEPWDARGLYQVGSFYRAGDAWSEWNGQYRDSIRRFIKGTDASSGIFATRLCGSQDLYGIQGSPLNSINFITAHDGFTLRDLVSYNQKHNFGNGENNRDGLNENESWNCGWEGATGNPTILRLRERQMRNHHLALMVSRGIPMILMGDEYGHTKQGNNNSWCQDGEVNWFRWDQLIANEGFFRFYRLVIQFRQRHAALRKASFMSPSEIIWHGLQPHHPNWGPHSRFIAFQLLDAQSGDLFIAFNMSPQTVSLTLPDLKQGLRWCGVADTARPAPNDIFEGEAIVPVTTPVVRMIDHSAILLWAHSK